MGGFTHKKRVGKDSRKRIKGSRHAKDMYIRTGRSTVIFPDPDVEEEADFVDQGIFIDYGDSTDILFLPYDVLRSFCSLPLRQTCKIIGLSETTMKLHVKKRTLKNEQSMVPDFPRDLFMKLSIRNEWPYRRLSEKEKQMIQRFRKDLLVILTDNGWDDRLVEMVKQANQVEEDLLAKPHSAVSRLMPGQCLVPVCKVIVSSSPKEQKDEKEIKKENHEEIMAPPPPSTPIVVDRLDLPLGFDQDISLGFWEGSDNSD